MRYSHWQRYNTFYGLAFTTTLATMLLLAELKQWRVTGNLFVLANRFPGSVALVVQMLAAFFGLLHVAVISKLINYALRLRINKVNVSLDVLRTWVDLSIPHVNWDLPVRFFFPVLFFVFLSLVPAALWAGSMSPSVARTIGSGMLLVPSYEDISMIREYPMMIGAAGPSMRSRRGFFAYSVGQQQSGRLMGSAASASSIGRGQEHLHPKLDNTQFSYRGRSYGVGAPVGLMDQGLSSNTQIAGYQYQEAGYLANVTCMYNTTSDFKLSGPVSEWIYAASGNLPDSVGGGEYSNYIGHDGRAIVAMGVAYSEQSPRRYLAIAAGEAYGFLNNTQCEFDFIPMMFNVTVDIGMLNITVRPSTMMRDFNPQRNITRTVVRQFELMSNDMTNLYVSLLGEAFNSSIAAYKMSRASASRDPFTDEEATLAGLTNSITAMADDMLVAYASAQLMVGRMFTPQPARVYLYALQFGQPGYIYAIFTLNLLIICAVLAEAVRTYGWASLGSFNYLDPRDLIIAASRGGAEIAEAADQIVEKRDRKTLKHMWLLSDPDEGNGSLVVNMKGDEDGHMRITVARAGDGGLKTPVMPSTPKTPSEMDMELKMSGFYKEEEEDEKAKRMPRRQETLKVGILGRIRRS
jgi:hypothetical protein